MTRTFWRAALLLGSGVAAAAECRMVDGNFILAGDLAAAAPAFAAAPATAVFGFAPRPGAQRLVTTAQLDRFAQSFGIAGTFPELCFVRASAPPDPAAAAAAMRLSLGAPDARIEIVEMSRFAAPPGPMVFPRESLVEPLGQNPAVWNGYVSYDGGRFAVWAKVRIAAPVSRVVAAVSLRAGQIVADGDVRLETIEDFPRRAAPLASLADAVGRLTRRTIPSGSPIVASALTEPNAVERGEIVTVEAHNGGAVLKLEAKAEAAGRRGDVIPLRNASTGKIFRARVEAKGRAEVEFAPKETTR